MPPIRSEDDDPNEPLDPDEPPPEPPDTLDVFEHQRYLSKLVEWGLEASKPERSRPHLVERDDNNGMILTSSSPIRANISSAVRTKPSTLLACLLYLQRALSNEQ